MFECLLSHVKLKRGERVSFYLLLSFSRSLIEVTKGNTVRMRRLRICKRKAVRIRNYERETQRNAG